MICMVLKAAFLISVAELKISSVDGLSDKSCFHHDGVYSTLREADWCLHLSAAKEILPHFLLQGMSTVLEMVSITCVLWRQCQNYVRNNS